MSASFIKTIDKGTNSIILTMLKTMKVWKNQQDRKHILSYRHFKQFNLPIYGFEFSIG